MSTYTGWSWRLPPSIRPERANPRDAGQTPLDEDWKWIEAAAGRPATHCFDGAQMLSMRRPCVYVWLRGREPLYVGKGSIGMARPLDLMHHKICNDEIRRQDRLVIYECDPGEEYAFERALIKKLKPTLNGREKPPPPSKGSGMLSLKEVAGKLAMNQATVAKWAKRLGPEAGFIRVDDEVRVDWAVFHAWVVAGNNPSRS